MNTGNIPYGNPESGIGSEKPDVTMEQ